MKKEKPAYHWILIALYILVLLGCSPQQRDTQKPGAIQDETHLEPTAAIPANACLAHTPADDTWETSACFDLETGNSSIECGSRAADFYYPALMQSMEIELLHGFQLSPAFNAQPDLTACEAAAYSGGTLQFDAPDNWSASDYFCFSAQFNARNIYGWIRFTDPGQCALEFEYEFFDKELVVPTRRPRPTGQVYQPCPASDAIGNADDLGLDAGKCFDVLTGQYTEGPSRASVFCYRNDGHIVLGNNFEASENVVKSYPVLSLCQVQSFSSADITQDDLGTGETVCIKTLDGLVPVYGWLQVWEYSHDYSELIFDYCIFQDQEAPQVQPTQELPVKQPEPQEELEQPEPQKPTDTPNFMPTRSPSSTPRS